MSLATITAADAKRLIERGGILVDIRDADEHARQRIEGARHHPLDTLTTLDDGTQAPIIFHCRAGRRTADNAAKLRAATENEAYILEGGIEAWKRAGLPVVENRNQSLEMGRQVQIAAGSLILLGVLLGAGVAPQFYLLSGLVGAGLILAGLSGWCGMARLLEIMPWNRRGAV
jgi:rhodanese-related sulfurtransferase